MNALRQNAVPTPLKLQVPIQVLPHGADLPLPSYATLQSAGLDLMAALGEPVNVKPMDRVLIPTGIVLALPQGFEAQIRPRSGLALKHGLTLLNSPGTIDADYRGEIKVIVVNLGQESFMIEHGMRIAQMVIAPIIAIEWCQTSDLSETSRGTMGFGHTGL